MKQFTVSILLVSLLLLGLGKSPLMAQTITAGKDSTVVRTDAEPLPDEPKGLSQPGRAALYSAIVPGLGQAYNKSYWKIPIVYAALGGAAYAIHFNHTRFLRYRSSLRHRSNSIPYTNDRYNRIYSDNQLRQLRDAHRRWRDLSMLYTVLAHGLNITEAYVHAHLKGFDVSEEISMHVRPDLMRTASNTTAPVLTLSFNFKK